MGRCLDAPWCRALVENLTSVCVAARILKLVITNGTRWTNQQPIHSIHPHTPPWFVSQLALLYPPPSACPCYVTRPTPPTPGPGQIGIIPSRTPPPIASSRP